MAADSAPTAGSDRSVPSTSADLIDPNEPVPADPAVRHGPERTRLNRQCAAILAAFRADPYREQTTAQLAAIACKYTSRISDLRRAGHRIRIHYRDRNTGVNVYRYDGQGEAAPKPPVSLRRVLSATRVLQGTLADLHRWMVNSGFNQNHPWLISIRQAQAGFLLAAGRPG